jgi:hypothetical protein
MHTPKWSLTLQVEVASSADYLLQGHQGGSGSQLLPQDQDSQELIWGPRGRHQQWGCRHHHSRSCGRRCQCCRRQSWSSENPAAGRCLQLLHRPPALLGRLGHWVLRRRLLRLMLIELVWMCLNLNRSDTWQQLDPAYRPASKSNKNQKDISVHTLHVHSSMMSVHFMKWMPMGTTGTGPRDWCRLKGCKRLLRGSHLYTEHQQYISWHTCM